MRGAAALAICVAAGTAWGAKWPFMPQTSTHEVIMSYGEYQDFKGVGPEYYFHPGIDIRNADAPLDPEDPTTYGQGRGTAIVWMEARTGKVLSVWTGDEVPDRDRSIEITVDGTQGAWSFTHLHEIADAKGFPWMENMVVPVASPPTRIATMGAFPGVPTTGFDHLHLMYLLPNEVHPIYKGMAPSENPLNLIDHTNSTPPAVQEIRLRRAGDDRVPSPGSFFEQEVGDRTVVYGNVDILARAYEKLGSFEPKFGVYSIGFSVSGPMAVPFVRSFRFGGRFAEMVDPSEAVIPNRVGSYEQAFFTVYSDDYINAAGSLLFTGPGDGITGAPALWYILTNTRGQPSTPIRIADPADPSVVADKDRYWNTDAASSSGVDWETPDGTAQPAQYASGSLFPDGNYSILVTATDSTNKSGSLVKKVTVDNFMPFRVRTAIGGLFGDQWTYDPASQEYKHAVLLNSPLTPGAYEVTIEFSEELSAAPNVSTDAGTVTSPLKVGATGKWWKATLSIPSGTTTGIHTLVVSGTDTSGNQLVALGPDQADFVQPRRASAAGVWAPSVAVGNDTRCSFTVGPAVAPHAMAVHLGEASPAKYEAIWNLTDATTGTYVLEEHQATPLSAGAQSVRIGFTAPVVAATAYLDSLNLASVLTPSVLSNTEWMGSFTIPAGTRISDRVTLRIAAMDAFGNRIAQLQNINGSVYISSVDRAIEGDDTRNEVAVNVIVADNRTPATSGPTRSWTRVDASVSEHPNLRFRLPRGVLPNLNTGRLFDYMPWSPILPAGGGSLQEALSGFSVFRGMNLHLCNVDATVEPDGQADAIADTIAAERDRMAQQLGANSLAELPAELQSTVAKVRVVGFGDQGLSAVGALTDSVAGEGVGAMVLNNVAINPPGELKVAMQYVEMTMSMFKEVSAAYTALMGVMAAVNSATNPALSAQMLQSALAYLQEHAQDILKCLVNDFVKIPNLKFPKLPGGASFAGFAEGLNGLQQQLGCATTTPPGGCNYIQMAASAVGFGKVYENIKNIEGVVNKIPKDLKRMRVMASNVSGRGSVTISESGLIIQLASIAFATISPTNAFPASFGILSSVLDTVEGNGSAGLAAQLGQGSGLLGAVGQQMGGQAEQILSQGAASLTQGQQMLTQAQQLIAQGGASAAQGQALLARAQALIGAEQGLISGTRGALTQASSVGTRMLSADTVVPGASDFLLGQLPSMPFLGDIVQDLVGAGFKGVAGTAGEDVMQMLSDPPVLTLTYPPDHMVVGLTSDRAIVRVEGHVSDYMPQFVKIRAKELNGPQVATVLDLVTLTTDPGGNTGNAMFYLDVPLTHGGAHTVIVTASNAAGQETTKSFTCYVVGTQFPRQDTVARGITSFRWAALDGATEVATGTGRLSFLSSQPGETPTQVYDAPTAQGQTLAAYYPDGSTCYDIVFVDPATQGLTSVVPDSGPTPGRFEARLASFYEGRAFVGVVGNADSKILKEWRLEFRGASGVPAAGGFLDPGHTIIKTAETIPGPIFRLMHFWDVSLQRLTGPYTVQTRLTDGHLPLQEAVVDTFYTPGTFAVPTRNDPAADEADLKAALVDFGNLHVLDQASFTLGTPIDPGMQPPTIAVDPYARVELRFEGKSLTATSKIYVNVYSQRAPPVTPLLDPSLHSLGPKYEIYAAPLLGNRFRLLPQDFTATDVVPRLTVHLTQTEVGDYSMPSEVLQENLGIYREDAVTGRRVLMETQRPLGTFTVFTTTGYLDGSFLVLPSNSAPRIKAVVASPLVFSPGNASFGRPTAGVFLSALAAASPKVYVTVDILTTKGVAVRALAKDVPVVLKYDDDGEEAPLSVPEGADIRIVNAANEGAQKTYHYSTDGAPGVAEWDGRDDQQHLVDAGVYKVRVRVADGVGNTSTQETVVVKDSLAPIITQIGDKPTNAPIKLDPSKDGSMAEIRGTATNLMSFSGYRVGVRALGTPATATPWVGMASDDLATSGWTFLSMPESYYYDNDETLSKIQITDGPLARWPIATLPKGEYEVGLFVLGLKDGVDSATTVVDATVVSNVALDPADGLYHLTVSPNPFKNETTLSAALYGSSTVVMFQIYDSNGGLVTELQGTRKSEGAPVFETPLALTGTPFMTPQAFTVTAFTDTVGVSAVRAVAFQIPDASLVLAQITSTNIDEGGILTVAGVASATGFDVLDRWRLVAAAGPTTLLLAEKGYNTGDEPLGSLDTSLLGSDSVTLTLSVRDVLGNEATDTKTFGIPLRPRLAVTPRVLTPQLPLDGVNDVAQIEVRLNRRPDSASLEIVPTSPPGAAVATRTVALSATVQSFTWDGSKSGGGDAPQGPYRVTLTAVVAGESALTRGVPILLSRQALSVTCLADVSASPVPRAYFDVSVSGSGDYDIPFTQTVTLGQYGTELWEYFPSRSVSSSADMEGSGNIGSGAAFTMDFRQTINIGVGAINDNCCRHWYADYCCTISGERQLDGNETNGGWYGVPNCLGTWPSQSLGYGVHTFWTWANMHDCDVGQDVCDTEVQRSIWTSRANTDPYFSSLIPEARLATAGLGIITVYAHRKASRPFDMTFTPTHTSHFDSNTHPVLVGGTPSTDRLVYSGTCVSEYSDYDPNEGTIVSVNYNGTTAPPAGPLAPNPQGFDNQFTFTYTGLTEATKENNFTRIELQRGADSARGADIYPYSPWLTTKPHYRWGSVDRILGGTATVDLRRDTNWRIMARGHEDFTLDPNGTETSIVSAEDIADTAQFMLSAHPGSASFTVSEPETVRLVGIIDQIGGSTSGVVMLGTAGPGSKDVSELAVSSGQPAIPLDVQVAPGAIYTLTVQVQGALSWQSKLTGLVQTRKYMAKVVDAPRVIHLSTTGYVNEATFAIPETKPFSVPGDASGPVHVTVWLAYNSHFSILDDAGAVAYTTATTGSTDVDLESGGYHLTIDGTGSATVVVDASDTEEEQQVTLFDPVTIRWSLTATQQTSYLRFYDNSNRYIGGEWAQPNYPRAGVLSLYGGNYRVVADPYGIGQIDFTLDGIATVASVSDPGSVEESFQIPASQFVMWSTTIDGGNFWIRRDQGGYSVYSNKTDAGFEYLQLYYGSSDDYTARLTGIGQEATIEVYEQAIVRPQIDKDIFRLLRTTNGQCTATVFSGLAYEMPLLMKCGEEHGSISVDVNVVTPDGTKRKVVDESAQASGKSATVFVQPGMKYLVTMIGIGTVSAGFPRDTVAYQLPFTVTDAGRIYMPLGVSTLTTTYYLHHQKQRGGDVHMSIDEPACDVSDNDALTVTMKMPIPTGGEEIRGDLKADLPTSNPWIVGYARVRDGQVRFEGATRHDLGHEGERDLLPTRYGIFERLALSGDPSATQIPSPDKTPHTAVWTLGDPMYPDSTDVDPDVTVVSDSLSSFALKGKNGFVDKDDGFMLGETYDTMPADQLQVKLKPPTVTPYVARTFLRINGHVAAGATCYVELTGPDGRHTVVREGVGQPSRDVLGYADVTGRVGLYTVVVSESTKSGVRQHRFTVDVGFPVGSTIVSQPNPGGVVTDAYEAATLVLPQGGLNPGVKKTMFLRQMGPDDVPLFVKRGIVPGLIYDLRVATNGVPDKLRPDDFVQNEAGGVERPGIMIIHYDDNQLPDTIDESAMNLFRLTDDGTNLQVMGSYVDTVENVIISEVTRSSTFEVMEDSGAPSCSVRAAPDPAGEGPVALVVDVSRSLADVPTVRVSTPGRPQPNPVPQVAQDVRPLLQGNVEDMLPSLALTSTVQDPPRRDLAILATFLNGVVPAEYQPVITAKSSGMKSASYVWAGATIYIADKPYQIAHYELVREADGKAISAGVRLAPIGATAFFYPDATAVAQTGWSWWATLDSGVDGVASRPMVSDEIVRVGGEDLPSDVVVLKTLGVGEVFGLPPAGFWTGKRLVIGPNAFKVATMFIEGSPAVGGRVIVAITGMDDTPVNNVASAGVLPGQAWTLFYPANRYLGTFPVLGGANGDGVGTATVYVDGVDTFGRTVTGVGHFEINTAAPMIQVVVSPLVAAPLTDELIRVSVSQQVASMSLSVAFFGKNPETLTADPVEVPGTGVPSGLWMARRTTLPADPNGVATVAAFATRLSGGTISATACFVVDNQAPLVRLSALPSRAKAGPVAITASVWDALPSVLTVTVFESSGHPHVVSMVPVTSTLFVGVFDVLDGGMAEGTAVAVGAVRDLAGNVGFGTTTVFIDLTPPAAPAGLSAVALGNGGSWLGWARNTEIDVKGYLVWRDEDQLTTSIWPQPPAGSVAYGDPVVLEGRSEALYSVVAVDLAGNQSPPAKVLVFYDLAPPVTSLVVGRPRLPDNGDPVESYAGQQPMYTSASTPLVFSATDTGSGVAMTEFRAEHVDLFMPFSFSLSGGIASTDPALGIFSFTITGAIVPVAATPVVLTRFSLTNSGAFFSASATPFSVLSLTITGCTVSFAERVMSSQPFSLTGLLQPGADMPLGAYAFTVAGELKPVSRAPFIPIAAPLPGSALFPHDVSVEVDFRSTDRAGNVEAVRTATLYVDTVAPATSLRLDGPWFSSSITGQGIAVSIPSATLSLAELSATLAQLGISFLPGTTIPFGSELQLSLEKAASNAQAGGAVFVSKSTGLVLTATDYGSGVEELTLLFSLSGGGNPITGFSATYTGMITLDGMSEGLYRLEHRAADRVGNRRELQVAGQFVNYLILDTTPPTTTMSIGQPSNSKRYPTIPIVVSSKTPFTFRSIDGGLIPCGVAGVTVFIGEEPIGFLTASSASLYFEAQISIPDKYPDDEYILGWQAIDHVGNIEQAGSVHVTLDNTAPAASITVPLPGGRLKGNQKVKGTATDPHFDFYRLEFAAGGTTLFTPIERQSEFSAPVVSDLLARWFAAHLPRGAYTLRMTVEDVVRNRSVVTLDLTKGGKPGTITPPAPPGVVPTFVRAIGVKGQGNGQMRLPIGVAVDAGGLLYVADTQNHRIEVFNAMAEYDYAFGRHGAGIGHFNQPEGDAVAVSGEGRLYVADRMNHRVQVFRDDGEFLFSIGHRGKGYGEFDQPSGIAVDGDGRVYVSDTKNNRVEVFTADGGYLSAFGDEGDEAGRLNEPAGIAVDAEGEIFVVDQMNDRIVAFNEDGSLDYVLGGGNGMKQPYGLALSPDGSQLYVSDTGHHEIAILDKAGQELARFGGFGASDGKFHSPHSLVWDVPRQLLYVADTHNNRVEVFGFGTPSVATSGAQRPDKMRVPNGRFTDLLARGWQLGEDSALDGTGPLRFSDFTLTPNPFEPRNGLQLGVRVRINRPARIGMVVSEKHGKIVRRVAEQSFAAGVVTLMWEGICDDGHPPQGGEYVVTLTGSDGLTTVSVSGALAVANVGGNVPGAPGQGVGQGAGGGQVPVPGQGTTPRGRAKK